MACSGIYSNFRRRVYLQRGLVHQPVPPIPPDMVLAHRSRMCFPMSGVTASGSMLCAYQNQIPPALMDLSYGGFPERSRSLAERVRSALEIVSSARDNEGETVASNNRLATITNSRTSTRTVIDVICFMVQLSSANAFEARSISPQQLCRLFR